MPGFIRLGVFMKSKKIEYRRIAEKSFIIVMTILAFTQTAYGLCADRFIDFESYHTFDAVDEPGMQFDGWYVVSYDDLWAPVAHNPDNSKAAMINENEGKIFFTEGTATYFSILTATTSGVSLEAYDEDGNIVDTSPTVSYTLDLVPLRVDFPGIKYVKVKGVANEYLIDNICTDAPKTATVIPEFSTIAIPVLSVILLMLLVQRRKNQ